MIKSLRTLALVAAVALATASAWATYPAGYYKTLTGKSNGDLKTAIYNLCKNFTHVSSYSALPQYFFHTDVYPNSNRWWDMYSDIPLYGPSFQGLNREHSFPKSWWGGSTTVGAYVDLNHLYPSEMRANTAKSNYPLGTVDTSVKVDFDNGITKVGYPVNGQGGGAKYVFEPADEYKGDFARTYFYMVTTYQDLTWKYTFMVNQNLYPTLNNWSVELLLKWHRQDPVSEKELNRNDVVYGYQNNRNPFIDYPVLAEYLWGNKKGQAFNPDTPDVPTGKPDLFTPTQDMDLDFGQVALGKSVTAQLLFRGEYLTQPVIARIYRDSENKGFFTMPDGAVSATIPANYINTDNGYWLTLTYTPTSLGQHTARVLINGGGVSGSRGIELRGECLPVPELGACTATAASDVTDDSYVANWTYPASDVVDYWVITRTKYVGGQATTEEIEAEGPGYTITGFGESDYETYSVQSQRLGYRSPMSNTVQVQRSGVTDITVEAALAVYTYEGGLRFITSATHTNAVIMDTMGRTVTVVPVVESNTEIALPAGIYMVVTDQQRRPVKVIVR